MNKSNKLLVGILAFVVVCVVGYALFSETITVTGTATAKGNFDIGFECTKTYTDGTTTANCSIEGQTITTTSTLNKPSDMVVYEITLTNNGSIPAVLKTVDSSNNYVSDGDGITADVGPGDEYYYDPSTLLFGAYEFEFTSDDGAFYTKDSVVEALKFTLQPGESIKILVMHRWLNSEDTLDVTQQPKLPENGATMNYNIELGFEQVTVN